MHREGSFLGSWLVDIGLGASRNLGDKLSN